MTVRWRWELYHHRGPKPAAHVERVKAWPGVTVLLEHDPHSLMVSAPSGFDRKIRSHLPDWTVRKVGRDALPSTA